jgi:hypothetical protein
MAMALVLAAAPCAAALAQERPTMLPTRDVMVTYRASGPAPASPGASAPGASGPAATRQQDMKVAIMAGGKLMRIEALGGGAAAGGYVIVDRDAQRMTMVITQDRRYMEMPANDAVSRGFLLNESMTFARRGLETVAGVKCTLWDVTSKEGAGSVCVTDDGVMLRARGQDGRGALEATAVQYAPQPASLFRPPADFAKIEMPGGAGPGGRPPSR